VITFCGHVIDPVIGEFNHQPRLAGFLWWKNELGRLRGEMMHDQGGVSRNKSAASLCLCVLQN
jgi:hypothetical protein